MGFLFLDPLAWLYRYLSLFCLQRGSFPIMFPHQLSQPLSQFQPGKLRGSVSGKCPWTDKIVLDYFLVAFVAFVASGLTLFSGFGLGTILLPAMILLFPPQLAVAATAVVHLANNVLKLVFFGRYCNKDVFIKFGFIAIVAAFAGANLLVKLSEQPPLCLLYTSDAADE